MIQVPHSERLAVFDHGPGRGTLRYGGRPDGKASMSFVDTDSMKITSRLELGWGIGQVLMTEDVDLETAKVLGQLSPSKAVTSAELSADGQYLYLLDRGEPSDKVERNVNGFLAVVSVSTRSELSAMNVGSAPRGLIHDNGSDRILILSDAAPGKKRRETGGELRIFKGAEALAVTPVAYSPADGFPLTGAIIALLQLAEYGQSSMCSENPLQLESVINRVG